MFIKDGDAFASSNVVVVWIKRIDYILIYPFMMFYFYFLICFLFYSGVCYDLFRTRWRCCPRSLHSFAGAKRGLPSHATALRCSSFHWFTFSISNLSWLHHHSRTYFSVREQSQRLNVRKFKTDILIFSRLRLEILANKNHHNFSSQIKKLQYLVLSWRLIIDGYCKCKF